MILLLLWLAAACRATQRATLPVRVVQPTRDSTTKVLVQTVISSPNWASHALKVFVAVQSSEIAIAQHDTVAETFQIHVVPLQQVTGNYAITLYTSNLNNSIVADSSIYTVSQYGQFLATPQQTSCLKRHPIDSPAFARLLIPRYAPAWPVVDTLQYTSCIQGLHTRVSVRFIWQSPLFQANSWSQLLQYSGTITADSTHLLPLHVRGELIGRATLWLRARDFQLDTADASVQVQLRGESSARSLQSIEQRLQLHISLVP
jgi:hypothetical protein